MPLLVFWTAVSVLAQVLPDRRLAVRTEVARPPHYVGQAIQADVFVIAPGLPTVQPPKIKGVDIFANGMELHPMVVEAIGNQVREKSTFVFHYSIVPRSTGVLVIPPFRVSADDLTGATASIQITPRPPPIEGRPLGFLGGIGELSASSQLDRETLRLGQEARLQISLQGAGAFGSSFRPEVRAIANDPIGIQIDPDNEQFVTEQARRVWTYRVRPTRAGESRIAPIVIASFDPRREEYRSQILPSLGLTVIGQPALSHDSVVLATRSRIPSARLVWLALVALALIALCVGISSVRYHREAYSPKATLRRSTRRLRHVDEKGLPSEALTAVACYLQSTLGRPEGALGCEEARELIEQATGSSKLGEEVQHLVEEAHAVLFGVNEPLSGSFRERMIDVLRRLSRARHNQSVKFPSTDLG
jgi:hypothetical protein